MQMVTTVIELQHLCIVMASCDTTVCMRVGSAHAVLGPYWGRILGKTKLRARQCSPRGGDVLVEVQEAEGRVLVSGPTFVVSKGHLTL